MNDKLASSLNYRLYLKDLVESRRAAGEDISFAKIAIKTKIQRTFLSQVMNEKHHLNNDQLYAVTETLGLPKADREHLTLLSEWQRCKSPARQERLQAKLEGRPWPEEAHGQMRITGTKADVLDDYFCDPLCEVVHRFLTIEKYRNDPTLIIKRLNLGEHRWQEIIATMRDCELIRIDDNGIKLLVEEIFPHELSAAEKIRHIQGRMKVSNQKLKQRNIDEFMYNWWFISNSEGKKKLKIEFLHLLRRILSEASHTEKRDVYQLSLDLLTP